MECPTCGRSTTWKDNPSRPFCSERCKTIDLGNWASEDYRVPSEPVSDLEHGEPKEHKPGEHSKE